MNSKIISFALCCVMLCLYGRASVMQVSLKKAMQNHMVAVTATSAGGYMNKSISLQLENKTNSPLDVYVDPALTFKPDDLSYQDLVVVGDEHLELEVHGCKQVAMQTFCGKSYAHSPRQNLHYTFSKQGDSGMIKVLGFIKEHQLYDYLGQSAVWVFTNKHCISSVYDSHNATTSHALMNLIGKVTGTPEPQYYTRHKINDETGAAVYSSGIEKAYVDIRWGFKNARNLHVGIFHENGKLYKEITDNENITATEHTVSVMLDPERDKENKYYVRLFDDDNNFFVQKEVSLHNDWCN